MQAYVLQGPNGPDSLHLTDLPTPTPGPDEVLVQVQALSLNPVDYKTARGGAFYGAITADSPAIPGWDVAGVVTQVGAHVTGFRPGDAVFGMVNFPGHGRAYAEYVAAPASHLAHRPATVSAAEAVAATLAALTAWQVLAKAQVQPSHRVLIHAAAGGVGHYAVQLAKERGAYVIGTASPGKVEFVRALGADEVVDYTQVKFEDAVAPVDFVLDAIGGDHLARSLHVVKPGGRLTSIVGISPVLIEQAKARGVDAYHVLVASSGADQTALAARLADGRLRSHVARTYPFAALPAALPAALRAVETGKTQGKIVVVR